MRRSISDKEKKHEYGYPTQFREDAPPRAWRCPPSGDAPSPPSRSRSASSISARSATTAGPGRTNKGRKAMVDALKGQVVADYVENVKEDASAIPVMKDLAQQGHKLIFTTSYGYMDQTIEAAKAVPRRQVGALHRLQARRQRRHLQLALLSGPSGDRHDRRHDVEDRRDRLCRVVQDPRGGDGRERLHACRRRRSIRRSRPSS